MRAVKAAERTRKEGVQIVWLTVHSDQTVLKPEPHAPDIEVLLQPDLRKRVLDSFVPASHMMLSVVHFCMCPVHIL
jgi:hypothetical protein